MRLIDTSKITATSGYPGLANVAGQSVGNSPVTAPGNPNKYEGLDFLQQALLEMVDVLVRSQIVDQTKATILATYSGGAGTIIWVYYGGEVFYLTYSGFPVGTYIAANITTGSIDDGTNAPLTTLSDGSTVSIHNTRIITLSGSSSPNTGSLPDFGNWLTIQKNFKWAVPNILVVEGSGVSFATGWSVDNRMAYYILGNEVTVMGDATFANGAANLVFTLPVGMRPMQAFVLPCTIAAGAYSYIAILTNGQVQFGGDTSVGGGFSVIAKFSIL